MWSRPPTLVALSLAVCAPVAAADGAESPAFSLGVVQSASEETGKGLVHLRALAPAELCDAEPEAAGVGVRRAFLLSWPPVDREACWIAGLVRLATAWRGHGHAYLVGDPGGPVAEPEIFAYRLKRASITIRAADPTARIVAGPLSGDADWIDRVAGLALTPYVDGVLTADDRADETLASARTLFPGAEAWSIEREAPESGAPPALIRAGRRLRAGADVAVVRAGTPVEVRELAALIASAPAGARPSSALTVRALLGPDPTLELIGDGGTRLLVMPARPESSVLEIGPPPPAAAGVIDPREPKLLPLALREFPSGPPRVRVQAADHPLLVLIDPSDDLNLEQLEVADRRPGLTAEEIVAREREVRARQDLALDNFLADARVAYHFTIANLGESVDVVTENEAFGRGESIEYRQTALYVNGSRWKGEPPAFPFIAPEKVKQVPLALSLHEGYRYRLQGEEKQNGRPCYRIAFEPGEGAEAAFRGTVWIDRETFFRVRMDLIRLEPTQPVTSDVLSQWYEPVEADGVVFRLITRMEGQMVFSALGHNAIVDRRVDFRSFRINGETFAVERATALASDDPMYRDSLGEGLVALIPDPDGGGRTVASATTKANTLLLMGWNGSVDGDLGLPFAGINWFDLDWRGKGIQLDLAWAGPFAALSATWPRSTSGWEPSIQTWLTAIEDRDRYVDEDGRARDEDGRPDEDLERLDERIQGFVRRPLGPYFTFSLEPSVAYFRASRRSSRTRDDYVLPPDTMLLGSAMRFDYLRGGYHVSLWAEGEHRLRWGPFGLPEDLAGPREFHDTPLRWGLRLDKNFHGRGLDRLGLDVDLFGGTNLDRFSAFQRLSFADVNLRGYDGAGLRFHRGATIDVRYAWRMGGNVRWELGLGGAIFRNPDDYDDVWHDLYGAGFGVTFPGPWSTLFRVRASYGIDSSLPVEGSKGSARVTVFKTFDGWWPWDRKRKAEKTDVRDEPPPEPILPRR